MAGDVFGSDILEKEGFRGSGKELKRKWGSPINGGSPKIWMVFVMENPMNMDDLGVPPF